MQGIKETTVYVLVEIQNCYGVDLPVFVDVFSDEEFSHRIRLERERKTEFKYEVIPWLLYDF